MSNQKSLLDKVLQELKTSRTSMELQSHHLADVLEKSNNLLLQIEASRTIKPIQSYEKTEPYNYNKDTINDLTKIVDKFIHLMSMSDAGRPTETPEMTATHFEDYLETTSQRAEYLGSNVRKLLAIWDTVQQMRTMLSHQDMEMDNDDKENNFT
ncbi:mitotic spindle density 1 [Musca autumnalis]|uniref:mitotic spindle density 1 n=1 Tax=Musca autumnalis TaxID=221902 RepID=UPI003CEFAD99